MILHAYCPAPRVGLALFRYTRGLPLHPWPHSGACAVHEENPQAPGVGRDERSAGIRARERVSQGARIRRAGYEARTKSQDP
jgi:hypothetical protein